MLVILPNRLDDTADPDICFPAHLKSVVLSLTALIAESEKAARRFLGIFMDREAFNAIELRVLSEHTTPSELSEHVQFVQKHKSCGLISDAGIPCIADPGAKLVFRLHQKKVPIKAHIGPCSILQALVLSGFNGQQFCFHGYLPREIPLLEKKLLSLEQASRDATQIWIDTPYRSEKILSHLCKVLKPETFLSIAKSLSLPTEVVRTLPIRLWQKEKAFFEGKEPAVFLISSEKGLS